MSFQNGDIFFRYRIVNANVFNGWLQNQPTMPNVRELNQIIGMCNDKILESRGVERREPTAKELEAAGQGKLI